MKKTNPPSRKTIPRKTWRIRCLIPTGTPGGTIANRDQIVEVDDADVGALLADGRFELAPTDAAVDIKALLRPEELAPPAPVRMRWIAGGSSRQFGGRSIALGDEFEVPPNVAASLLHDCVAEVISDE